MSNYLALFTCLLVAKMTYSKNSAWKTLRLFFQEKMVLAGVGWGEQWTSGRSRQGLGEELGPKRG